MTRTAVVIGAGVVGVATAYALARRGIAVTLVDRRGGPALETSFSNGAQLSWQYTDALASPRLLKQLPALALGLHEAFRLRPSLDPAFLDWLMRFLRNCTGARFRANTLAALELGLLSREAMSALLARHPLNFEYSIRGKMQLYADPKAFEAARVAMEMKIARGAVQSALTPGDAAAIEPALEPLVPRLAGVIYSPDEAVGDSHRFCNELRGVLEREYGVTTRFDFDAQQLELTRDGVCVAAAGGESLTANIAVVCTGVSAGRLLRAHGLRLPIWPLKGYSFMAPPGPRPPVMSITDTQRRLVFTRLRDGVRVAGFAELGERSIEVSPDRVASFIDAARQSLPEAALYDQATQVWAGLRPLTPDTLPRIGRPHPALAYNVGHGMLGWTLAMGSAERVAALMTGEQAP